jgi:hypothetical protein
MAAVIMDGVLQLFLDALTTSWGAGLKLHLFKGAIVPAHGDTLAAYLAAEANFTGYAPIVIGAWGASALSGRVAVSTAAQATFTVGGGNLAANAIGGYFVTDGAITKLYFAEADPNQPINMTNVGNTYKITPTTTYDSVAF